MKHTITFLLLWATLSTFAQKQPLTYFLPDIPYDKNLPTPEAWLGFQIGEWHISHDQLLGYMKTLAAASPRAKLVEHGRTFENRPLVHLIITSEKNHKSLDDLKNQHAALSNPSKSAGVDLGKVPAVLYQGYTIHGNEPSGSNAAMLVAYYLLAGKSKDIDRLLEDVVIIFDPCFNPDGMNRFASWVNTHRNKNLSSDPADREFNEPWPRGRSNHYWFDLNRDWLPAQLPESQGRVRIFHEWKPNVLTDHHEMGSNTTFFFMPGVPSRVHPLTPKLNQELTERIGNYHAEALDGIGSLYFTKEGYDDFYYGKGSTYPDANGCVGILFEQASSRGHVQQTDNGELTFAFTIRNQVVTSLSTHKAVREMKKDLLSYQRDFYTSALEEARSDPRKAYVFGDPADRARTAAFIEILRRHQIDVYTLKKNVTAAGHQFAADEAYIVPLDQPQYRLIHGIFETRTSFEDSIFYDISGWTYPLAFNLPYATLEKRAFDDDLLLGNKIAGPGIVVETPAPEFSEYAYLMEWTEYYAPKALNYLLRQGLRMKVASTGFTMDKRTYPPGTILLPVAGQGKTPEQIHGLITIASQIGGVRFYDMDTGLTPIGIDLGSDDFRPLKAPEVLLLVGEGVRSTDAGEIWHLLDQRYDMRVTKVEMTALGRVDLYQYTTVIMPGGNYGSISGGDRLKEWVNQGGVIVAYQEAVQWLRNNGLAFVEFRQEKASEASSTRRPYVKREEDRSALQTSGAVFENLLDNSHPIGYGYTRDKMPVFRSGNLYFEPAKNPYATPLLYTPNPLMSGYLNSRYTERVRGSAGAVVSAVGRGRVIGFADNTQFRAFWFGANKLLANAIFFGHTIHPDASERSLPKE